MTGNLPVVPYPVDNLNTIQYYLDYASTKAILVEVGVSAATNVGRVVSMFVIVATLLVTLSDPLAMTITRYWGLPAVEEAQEYSPREAADRFRDLFRDAVRIRLRSDVAIGSCLSGGLDSSSIVCVANDLMFVEHAVPRELIGERQKTFSSCFEDPTYDERRFIRPVL